MNMRLYDGSARCGDCMDACSYAGYTDDACTYCDGRTILNEKTGKLEIVGRTPRIECGYVLAVVVDGNETESVDALSYAEMLGYLEMMGANHPSWALEDAAWERNTPQLADVTGATESLWVTGVTVLPIVPAEPKGVSLDKTEESILAGIVQATVNQAVRDGLRRNSLTALWLTFGM